LRDLNSGRETGSALEIKDVIRLLYRYWRTKR
jgi:hypothetical protein